MVMYNKSENVSRLLQEFYSEQRKLNYGFINRL